ncbi:mannan-binding lectin [Polyangium aurulentum]|uniref:mannan-binding lectin n=1 Tax=Polyangium aurulentum TaxID=2567896 RepID=UPI00197E1940|nr:mannan-binding lectin [Polyangium aurulentum]UQA57521.1 mannan-binding lectin [Polyangium aurulentum]
MIIKHSFTALVTSSALAITLAAGCGAAPEEDMEDAAQNTEEMVDSTSQALGPACTPTTLTLEAGPIWSGYDANGKCPSTCNGVNMDWNGQWWTTVSGSMSVCQCSPRPPVAVEAGPIWSGYDANGKCPSTCSNTGRRWTGQWWTTVPGAMSVCECDHAPPTVVNQEAGPIWSGSDANNKCPSVCGSTRAWNGQWWTTVSGAMSVCQCECTP